MHKVKRLAIGLAVSLFVIFATLGVGVAYEGYYFFVDRSPPSSRAFSKVIFPITWPELAYQHFIDPDSVVPAKFGVPVVIAEFLLYAFIVYLLLALLSRSRKKPEMSDVPPPPPVSLTNS